MALFYICLFFLSFFQDEKKSTILGNEVLAVDIGAPVANLTNKISVNLLNATYVSKKTLKRSVLNVDHLY